MSSMQFKYNEKLCAALEGGTVDFGGATPEGYPTLIVRCTDGKRRALLSLRDPEDNGPGAFEVAELNE